MTPFQPGFTGINSEIEFRYTVKGIISNQPLFDAYAFADQYMQLTHGESKVEDNSQIFLDTTLPTLLVLIGICEHNELYLKNFTLPLSKVFRGKTLEPFIALGCMVYQIFYSLQQDDPDFYTKLDNALSKYQNYQDNQLLSEEFKSATSYGKLAKIFNYLSMFAYRKEKEPGLMIANDYILLRQDPILHNKNKKPPKQD